MKKLLIIGAVIFCIAAIFYEEPEETQVEEKPKVTKTVQQLSEAQQNVLNKFNTFESHVNDWVYMNKIEREEVDNFFNKKYMIIHPEEYNDSFVYAFKNAAKTYINMAELSYDGENISRAYSDSEELFHAIENWLPEIQQSSQ